MPAPTSRRSAICRGLHGWIAAASGRFDILVAQPVATLVTQGEQTEIRDASGVRYSDEDPFSYSYANSWESRSRPYRIFPLPEERWDTGATTSRAVITPFRRSRRTPSICRRWRSASTTGRSFLIISELSARLVSRQRYAETAQVLPQILERVQGAVSRTGRAVAFQGARKNRFQFHSGGLSKRVQCGAEISARRRLLSGQPRATLFGAGIGRCICCIS